MLNYVKEVFPTKTASNFLSRLSLAILTDSCKLIRKQPKNQQKVERRENDDQGGQILSFDTISQNSKFIRKRRRGRGK